MYIAELFEKYAEWKILRFFLENPQKELYVKEVARQLKVSPGTASVTLNKAHKSGILNKKVIANIHLYSLNKNNEVVKKLRKVVMLL